MTSRLVDRPCGVGFLDLTKYSKFLTCGVDDSRDVIGSDDDGLMEFARESPPTPEVLTLPPENSTSDESPEPPPPTEDEPNEADPDGDIITIKTEQTTEVSPAT